MSNARKLQTEIDKIMKKIDEGVIIFDDIWDKVYAATQQNQKEKYESDLKKEIKKLQRYRDQVKTWIANNDVKDKKALVGARKLIESKMEQFKVCEKETKTKAYSKEGLAQLEKVDPEQAARNDSRDWLQGKIDEVNAKVDEAEAEIEEIESRSKRKKKNNSATEALEELVTQHKWHIVKMETVLRLVVNQELQPDDVEQIKDDIEYYIESFADPDYFHDENMYDGLDLDNFDVVVAAAAVGKSSKKSKDDDEEEKKDTKASRKAAAASAAAAPAATTKKKKAASGLAAMAGSGKSAPTTTSSRSSSALPVPGPGARATSSGLPRVGTGASSNTMGAGPGVSRVQAGRQTQGKGDTLANILKSTSNDAPGGQQQKLLAQQRQLVADQRQQQLDAQAAQQQKLALKRQQEQQQQQQQQMQQQRAQVQQQAQQQKLLQQRQQEQARQEQLRQQQVQSQQHVQRQREQQQAEQQAEAEAASALGSAAGAAARVLNPRAQQLHLALLNASVSNAPQLLDSQKSTKYQPRNAYATNPAFPTNATRFGDNPELFEKFDTDTLFFIFYYQQGTYQQFLAARELKKQSWRYHKKYMTWFQRHEEPKVTTDEYEQGTYVYFDYETGWCQRIKSEFTFEYSYLEDELQ